MLTHDFLIPLKKIELTSGNTDAKNKALPTLDNSIFGNVTYMCMALFYSVYLWNGTPTP